MLNDQQLAALQIDRLREVKAEMLEALEQIRGQMKEANAQSYYGSEMDKCINAALELAEAAIKKAKEAPCSESSQSTRSEKP
jgi:hypothetical protein